MFVLCLFMNSFFQVIYALNTKNDEHEAVIQTLRDQHEDEMQQILADAKQKVALYKDRLEAEKDHCATIEMLQLKVAEYKLKHSSVQGEFSVYKAEMKECQEKEKRDYSAKLKDMSQEVAKAKEGFEEQLNKFRLWKEKVTAEHATVLAELERNHQLEMEDLHHNKRDQDDTWTEQCARLEEKFKNEVADLKSCIEMLENDKIKLSEEHMLKYEKTKAFYEKELEELRNRQTKGHDDEIVQMKKEMDRLKFDFDSSDREMRMQTDKLAHKLVITEDELKQSQQQLVTLQAQLAGKESNSSVLSREVSYIGKR